MTNDFYQATSSNSVITYSSSLIPTPVVLQGFSVDTMLEVEDVDNVEVEIGLDGAIQSYVKPVLLPFKITFMAGSPSITDLNAVQDAQSSTGLVVNGELNVYIPAINRTFNYKDFIIKSANGGYGLGDKVKERTFNCVSRLPNQQTIPSNLPSQVSTQISRIIGKSADRIGSLF